MVQECKRDSSLNGRSSAGTIGLALEIQLPRDYTGPRYVVLNFLM